MSSIFFCYVFGILISLLMIVVVIIMYITKKESRTFLKIVLPFIIFFLILSLNRPSLKENIKVYNTFYHIEIEDVKRIEISSKDKFIQIIDVEEMKNIINVLKLNKFHTPNHPNVLRSYQIQIFTKINNVVIQFEVLETDNDGVLLALQNNYKGNFVAIGHYQNNTLQLILEQYLKD